MRTFAGSSGRNSSFWRASVLWTRRGTAESGRIGVWQRSAFVSRAVQNRPAAGMGVREDSPLTGRVIAGFLLAAPPADNEQEETMQGKIALEEHFAIEDTLMDSAGFLGEHVWQELTSRLLDIHVKRLAEMDKHGIEITILSLNAPAVQAIPDKKRANDIARKANDFLAE